MSVPCDHLRRKTTRARRTLRPLDLNNRGEQQQEDKECMNHKDEQWFIGSIYCGWLVKSWMNKTRMKGLLPLGKARQEGVYVESGASKTSTLEAE